MKAILKCEAGHYTLKEVCDCGKKAIPVIPHKYGPEDKYADYRRRVKEKVLKEKGLL